MLNSTTTISWRNSNSLCSFSSGKKPFEYILTILPRILKWIQLIMLEHFFTFLNGFHKRSSSTRQSATTKKSADFSLSIARIRFYGIMLLGCSRIKFIIRIKIDKAISIHTMKLKVYSSFLKKEKLSRKIKAHKLSSQNTIFLEQITLGIIKFNILSRRKRTSRVIPTLPLINICPWSSPTADRVPTSQLNASRKRKGISTKVNRWIRLLV